LPKRNVLNLWLIGLVLTLSIFSMPADASNQAKPGKVTRTDGIAATVGDRAVTDRDVTDRMRLIMISSGMPDTPDLVARLRPQVVAALVDEAVRIQEAARLKLKVEDADIDKAFAEIAKQNNLSADKFLSMLKKAGINPQTLRHQIRAQLLWVKVVTRKIRPTINVSESDIDAEIAQQKTLAGQQEYLIAEIVLPFDSLKSASQASDLAERIAKQVRVKPTSFPELARQFSRAAGASQGGNAGWFVAAQLPSERAAVIGEARAGMVLGPIKTADSYDVIMVRDMRTRTIVENPNREEIATRIGLERLDRQQRRYLMDLKSASFVDIRAQ
jgi:peptidyl-prolyl cis-trans isomerase SurA